MWNYTSFRCNLHDKILSMTIPWLSLKSPTFLWHLYNSLTFLGFLDKWSSWKDKRHRAKQRQLQGHAGQWKTSTKSPHHFLQIQTDRHANMDKRQKCRVSHTDTQLSASVRHKQKPKIPKWQAQDQHCSFPRSNYPLLSYVKRVIITASSVMSTKSQTFPWYFAVLITMTGDRWQ